MEQEAPVATPAQVQSGASRWLPDLWALFAEARHTMGTTARTKTLNFSQPHVLRNEREYDAAVAWADELTDDLPAPGSKKYEVLRFLLLLIEAYDDEHYQMGDKSTPQDAVDFMLDQKGKTRADLADLLGGRSRVSEFFSRKRRLSIEQVRKLRDELGVPADLLIA